MPTALKPCSLWAVASELAVWRVHDHHVEARAILRAEESAVADEIRGIQNEVPLTEFSCKCNTCFAADTKAVLECAGYIPGEMLIDLPDRRM